MRLLPLLLFVLGCSPSSPADAGPDVPSGEDANVDAFVAPLDAPRGPGLRVVTFNTGTAVELDHDAPPDDGYGEAQATLTDTYYGNGLAWVRAVEDTRAFLARLDPDVLVFQEIFHSPECESIPADARAGFVCETWIPGDPTVVQAILGPDYQVACNLEKPDKCAAVHRRVGTFRGCDADLCLDGLAGARVMDCGSGSRIGRGVIDLVGGGTLTVVLVHGSSGLTASDSGCRTRQFRQVFEDLGIGDGPAANGEVNLIMGDFNTDPERFARFDTSAEYLASRIAAGPFTLLTDWPEAQAPTYLGSADIDHVLSDAFDGTCFAAGVTPGSEPPTEMVLFDHRPVVCDLIAR